MATAVDNGKDNRSASELVQAVPIGGAAIVVLIGWTLPRHAD
jgi:hypothetical protein